MTQIGNFKAKKIWDFSLSVKEDEKISTFAKLIANRDQQATRACLSYIVYGRPTPYLA